jgi:signal transduction histidine kinase
MKSLRYALWFIGIVGVVSVAFAVTVVLDSDKDSGRTEMVIMAVVPSLSFIGAGLFAWWRRPTNLCGALMTATGFAWLMVPLQLADSTALFAVALIFENTAWLFLAPLLLVYPTGRLGSRSQLWLIGAIFVDGFVLGLLWLFFSGPRLAGECSTCPDNPLGISESTAAADALDAISSLGAVVLIVWTLVLLGRRFSGLVGADRIAARPLIASGSLTIALLAATTLTEDLGVPDDTTDLMFFITALSLSTLPFAYLIGLLRSRITGAEAVNHFVLALGESSKDEGEVERSLAKALGDPSLRIAYWLDERNCFADRNGQVIDPPPPGSMTRLSPIEYDGELIAAILHTDSIEGDDRRINVAGSAAALALRNQRLTVELRATVEELRASRARIVESSDAARRTLERNLHDGAQQHLVSMALTLRMARKKFESDPIDARALLDRAAADLEEATNELRELARGIHPAILTDRGLGPALGALAGRSPVPVELSVDSEVRLPPPVESAAYFVVAEALTNVARYSNASRAGVHVRLADGNALVEVTDDGRGGADINAGTGLRGLQDRVAALGGRLSVASVAGTGTTIRAELPCVQS